MFAPQLVSKIMFRQSKTWNTQAIAPFVDYETLNLIREVPMGNTIKDDRIVWPMNSSGLYSVRFGYHKIVVSVSSIVWNNHWFHLVQNGFWNGIWRATTLPKIKLFLWRMMGRILPTRLNLFKKQIIDSLICPICNQFEEFEEHSIHLFPWTHVFWFGFPLNYHVNSQSLTTVDRWFNGLLTSLESSKND